MNPQQRRPRAISYARFSSGKQAQGTSIERQDERFLKWLGANDQYEPLIFVDRGISAYRGRNASEGHLAEILELAKNGDLKEGDLLVVEAIDRLSRQSPLDTFQMLHQILSTGLKILTLEDHQTYDKKTGETQVILLAAKVDAAHSYSRRLGERVAAAHTVKRQRARNKETTGIVTVSWLKDGKLVEPFAGLVREAVRLYLLGHGHRAIVKTLQRTIEADSTLQARYPKPISATTVKRWLKSSELVGDWDSRDGLIAGAFEPLISNVEYQRLQSDLKSRAIHKSRERTYLLSGLVRCKECGASFHTRVQKPAPTLSAPLGSEAYLKKSPILYCNCSRYLKDSGCVNNTTWPYDVLLFIYNYGLGDALAAIYMDTRKPIDRRVIDQLEEQMAKFETSIQRRGDLFMADGDRKHLDEISQTKEELLKIKGQYKDLLTIAGNQDETSLIEHSVHDLSEIEKMPDVQLRSLLSKYGYQINISGRQAKLSLSPEGREVFTLVRRSQKHSCYILKIELPEWPEQPQEPDWVLYYAVGKNGIPKEKASTESELLSMLDGTVS